MPAKVAKAERVKSEINVTPLVDVVLVLLIIFMVVTPMLQKGPAVRLPVTEGPPRKPDDSRQLLVVIQADGTMWVDKRRLTEDGFAGAVTELFQRNPGGAVVVKGDARLDYGTVKKAMLRIRDAGFRDVGLIAAKRETGP